MRRRGHGTRTGGAAPGIGARGSALVDPGPSDCGENIGLSGATVCLSGASSAAAATDKSGQYAFPGLVAGYYRVGISGCNAGGYELEVMFGDVTVARDQTWVVDLEGRRPRCLVIGCRCAHGIRGPQES